MSAHDPAVEAAIRAWNGPVTGDPYDDMKRAAREALDPIRELHKPDGPYGYQTQCVACGLMWPCNTARLIYTTEELQS